MEEKRRGKRTKLESRLIIKRIDSGSHQEVQVEVTDLSKTGVGFSCDLPLEIGNIYEAYLTIWTHEVIHAFLQIVRTEMKASHYSYGSLFVGLPEVESSRIGIYQTINEE